MSRTNIGKANARIASVATSNTFYAKFTNGGSDVMTVNGSVTPVEFTLEELPLDRDFLLTNLSFVIGGDTVFDLQQFGNIAALTNGVIFRANQNLAGFTADANIKTNGDAILISSNVDMEAVEFGATSKTAIFGTWSYPDTYQGNSPLIRNSDLRIIIQDDLSTMDYLKVSAHGILLDANI